MKDIKRIKTGSKSYFIEVLLKLDKKGYRWNDLTSLLDNIDEKWGFYGFNTIVFINEYDEKIYLDSIYDNNTIKNKVKEVAIEMSVIDMYGFELELDDFTNLL